MARTPTRGTPAASSRRSPQARPPTGSCTLGGLRLAIRRPRVRSADDETELPLTSNEAASATDLLADGIVARMLAGLSTRRYAS